MSRDERFGMASSRFKVAAAAALLACTAGVAAAEGAAPPSLLLVTFDTWRWDYIGVSGSRRVETPNLDALAREGLYAREVLSPCPLTTPAHATLLTGLVPLRHGVLDCTSYRLAKDAESLAEAFRSKGYRTAAFLSAEPLHRRFGLDRGFEIYDDSGWSSDPAAAWLPAVRDGAATTAAALRWAGSTAGVPSFLWVHYFDAHPPYRARPKFEAKYPKDPYAQQVAFVDEEVGRLVRSLPRGGNGPWRVVVVGDHGEGLGDHGEREHGLALYRETTHVPLLVWPRPAVPVRLPEPWGLQDLAPTLREWFGLPAAKEADGTSLFRGSAGERDLPLLTALPALVYGTEPGLGVRRGRWLYLKQGREELFDAGGDPAQATDRSAAPADRRLLVEMRGRCSKLFPGERLRERLAPSLQSSPEEMKRLESLGYIPGGVSEGAALLRVDIRTLLADQGRVETERERAAASGQRKGLLSLYEALLPRYPSSAFVLRNLAIERIRTGDCAGAVPLFERAVRLRPQDGGGLASLGGAYMACRDFVRARTALEESLRLSPRLPEAHKNLGILFAQHQKDPSRAIQHLGTYLELEPGSTEAPAVRSLMERLERERAAAAGEETGIEGVAVKGPMHAGPARSGGPGSYRPLEGAFTVLDDEGRVAGRFRSDSEGRFRLALPPGPYRVLQDGSTRIGQEKAVVVEPGGWTQVTLRFDTGMR